ncbi:MAG: DUF1559 domain-containing protein [Lentisphaerae bacterium]|nr:DUF1559 domain-containing protein [Lentisphaerota bacterium]
MLPALNSARERGRAANCVSNTKQMGTMLQNYTADHDDYVVTAKRYNNYTWAALTVAYGYLERNLLVCPSITDGEYVSTLTQSTPGKSGAMWQWNYAFYGINCAIGSNSVETNDETTVPTLKLSSATVPTQTMAFADSYCRDIGQTHGWSLLSKNGLGSGGIAERHNNQAALVFLDGHTELWEKADTRVRGESSSVTYKDLKHMNPHYSN